MSARDVLTVAREQIGVKETPAHSNLTKYGADYAWNGVPWCVIFLWWCFREAGESAAFYGGSKTASCGYLQSWARSEGVALPLGTPLQAGDIVLYNFNGGMDPEHCGIVEHVYNSQTFDAIEGNTSPAYLGSQDNGGEVCRKTRYYPSVVCIIRPAYSQASDIIPVWAKSTIDKITRKGYLKGTGDGLELSRDMLRVLVILDRAGAFGGD